MDICFSSKDDPYMLYAALQSGQNTLIVTRDEMRDHSYLLGPQLQGWFRQWQLGHQIVPYYSYNATSWNIKFRVIIIYLSQFVCIKNIKNSLIFSMSTKRSTNARSHTEDMYCNIQLINCQTICFFALNRFVFTASYVLDNERAVLILTCDSACLGIVCLNSYRSLA